MNRIMKMAAAVPILIAYLVTSGLTGIVPVSGRRRRAMKIRTTSFFSKLVLKMFGITVHVHHSERIRAVRGGCLVVSNHLSYLDVLVISSLLPSVFVTSMELKRSFLLGALAQSGGCLFVERRKRSGLKREIRDIARVLAEGFPVALFPEGTTSNGDRVHAFKNPLFDAAIAESVDIFPLCLRYAKIDGKGVTAGNRDSVYYYGGITFFQHLPRLLALKSVEIDVLPLTFLSVHSGHSRKNLSSEAHAAISAAYHA